MKKIYFLFLLCAFSLQLFAQENNIHCYPTNWWVGMKHNHVQIMLYGKDIGAAKSYQIQYPGVVLQKINKVENKDYVFLDVFIGSKTQPGWMKIAVQGAEGNSAINFEIKARRNGKSKEYAQGITSKDFMYLIMPDRFSNGDESNDRIAGMKDQSLRRDTVYERHGGDLKGIQNHLNYLEQLGVTAIWLNPVWENDMPNRTEHGYAFTNHYLVDRRLGGNKAYQELIDAAHAHGMKIVQDAVYNHVGRFHFTVQNPPMKDWLNQWDTYTNTNYKDQTLFDPYASQSEKKIMSDGWFTTEMPDLNQKNPFVANFLIQHALWTVEEFGIDGWRIDTYAYNDLDFMNRCNQALMDEYPRITLFGETFVHGVPNQSYFCQNNYQVPFKSNLQAVTDFQSLWAITDAMTKDFGWTDGVNKLYTVLAQDFVYKDPYRNVIFLDNHDLARFYSVIGENVDKYQSALCWLLTCRGIPQLYYTSEFATTGFTNPNDGLVRLDFPGGWKNDSINKFVASGRTAKDQSIYHLIETLANYRKKSSALTTGKLMQFLPQDGLYVYFRYDQKQTVMVIMNTAKTAKKVEINRYSELTSGWGHYINVLTQEKGILKDFSVPPYQTFVYELQSK